ncbi:MAG: hypothetical protein RLZ98_1882 [Pseudomonadota bacterium]|jgi:hypothetical protein
MSWQTKIFAYCERGNDSGFWAEPVNAVTNIAFVVAAFAALRLWLRLPDRTSRLVELALIAIVFTIGIGSFLFHTFATRWAALADVAPITVFMLAYLAYALVRFLGLAVFWSGLATLLFFISLPAAGLLSASAGAGFFAGSASYLPALVVLLVVGVLLLVRRHPAGVNVLAAALVFGGSLTLRTIDMASCGWDSSWRASPLGTHFAWHVLNAVLLYLLLAAALRHGRRVEG